MTSGTFLDRIIPRTVADTTERKTRAPLADVEARAKNAPKPLDFAAALTRYPLSLIAEVKKASPSKGQFVEDLDVAALARTYVSNGAAAVSVLTDGPFFQGSLADMKAVRAVTGLAGVPVLRKDFIVDPYQVYEARAWGADALLLIVAVLEQGLLRDLLALTRSLGMEALVEVHDGTEAGRAVEAGAQVIGINNRDLRTFVTDLKTTERVIGSIPRDRIAVSESGIATRADAERLYGIGARAVLVGEALILAPDTAAKVRELSSVGRTQPAEGTPHT